MAEQAPPGWYQAETDPPGTHRYWDGTNWSAETRPAAPAPRTGDYEMQPGTEMRAGQRTTPYGRTIASPWKRIGARIIDVILLGIIGFVLFRDSFDWQSGAVEAPTLGETLIVLAIGAAYEIGFTALRAATPGKMAVGIEIVPQEGAPTGPGLGWSQAALRWVPNLASPINDWLGTIVSLASLILIFSDDMRRSVFDFVGKTYVVDK